MPNPLSPDIRAYFQVRIFYFIPFIFLFLTNCAETVSSQRESEIERLSVQIAQFQSDPEIIAFLANEAVNARVSSINVMQPDWENKETGVKRYEAEGLYILNDRTIWIAPGSGGVVNITHEIAHAYSYRQGCTCHSKEWIEAYLGIAERFEAAFPGRRWSWTTPTNRVKRNIKRYGIKM